MQEKSWRVNIVLPDVDELQDETSDDSSVDEDEKEDGAAEDDVDVPPDTADR